MKGVEETDKEESSYVLKRNQGQNRQSCTKIFHIFHALLAEKKHVAKLKTTAYEKNKNMMKYSKSKETFQNRV